MRRLSLAVLLLGCAGVLRAQVSAPPFSCNASSGTPPVIAADAIARQVGDLVLTCTGGTPTAGDALIPQVSFQIVVNSNVTSRLLASIPDWSEALLLIDEPAPTAQFPCDQPSGICPGYGNGLGTGYYGGGTQSFTTPDNRNAFQGQQTGANTIVWTVPADPPGAGATRIFRFTNLRVNTSSGLTSVVAVISTPGQIQIPIGPSPSQTVAFVLPSSSVATSVRDSSNSSDAPNGVPVPLGQAANMTRFATLRFSEVASNAARTRTAAAFVNSDTSPPPVNQNIPGAPYRTETGFYNANFGTYGARGNLGLAGLADSGIRYRAVLSNIPAGVNVFVNTSYGTGAVNGATARLVSTDAAGAGPFSPVPGTNNLTQLTVTGGIATAVWEVLQTDNAFPENFDFGVYLSYPANLSLSHPPAITVLMSHAPVSTVTTAAPASVPIPRFVGSAAAVPLFTFLQPAPVLLVTPPSLAFGATAGGADPAPQNLAIASTPASLTFTITSSGNIPLTIQPLNGTTPASASVAVSIAGLNSGRYASTLTVASPGAAPVAVPVSLIVNAPAPPPRITSVLPSTVVAGGPTFGLAVIGANFSNGSVVRWNGVALNTGFASSTQLGALVPASLIASPGAAAITVINPDGSISNSVGVNVVALLITSLSPATVIAGGPDFTLTISGSGFATGATAQVAGTTLQPASLSATQITVNVPASLITQAGTAQVTVTNPGNVVSNALPLAITAITGSFGITALNPDTVSVGGPAFALTISGNGFASGATVQIGGTTLQPASLSATQITVNVPSSAIAQAGTLLVTVANPAATAAVVSNPLPLTVGPIAITSISPNTVTATRPAFPVLINGGGFAKGATVRVGGTTLQPATLTATQITVNVPSTAITTPGPQPVIVTNPGGVSSNSVNLTVNGVPAILSLDPASATVGSVAFTLTVSGSNFFNGAQVLWNGVALNTTFIGATQLTAQASANLLASAGSAAVTVVTIDSVSSSPATFTINALPSVSGLSPGTVTAGSQNVTLMATGSGFLPGSQVVIQRPPAPPVVVMPVSVSATQITVRLPDNVLMQPGPVVVRIMSPGGELSNPLQLNITLPSLPAVTFSGPATAESAQDQMITLALGGMYPVDLQGRLTLTFTPDGNLPNDPAIQFQNGSRVFDFIAPAGSLPRPQVTLKTGTVAGLITVTPSFSAGGSDVTPAGVAIQRIQIARAAPVLTFVDCIRISATSLNVIADGYTNTRMAGQTTFDFQPALAANLGTTQLQTDATPLFTTWFGGAGSATAGGTFRYTQGFNVQGNAGDVGAVNVRLANAVGTSAARGVASCRQP